ncbi:MAG: hypothetical protein FJZ38_05380 [Candidatus Rokubacteria bacterium]|nr:hypothetical protein [Candidatus Rokubacteria bacterium]
MSGLGSAVVVLAVLALSFGVAAAGPQRAIPKSRQWTDITHGLLEVARDHRRSLEAAVLRRERDFREASASLDRNSEPYARGIISRAELDAAAREAGTARAQLEWTRQELVRTTALIVELEGKQRLAIATPSTSRCIQTAPRAASS